MSCCDLCIVLIFVLDVSVLDGHAYLILYLTQTLNLYYFFKSCKIMKHFDVSTLNRLKMMSFCNCAASNCPISQVCLNEKANLLANVYRYM